jgi:hypothetical protein
MIDTKRFEYQTMSIIRNSSYGRYYKAKTGKFRELKIMQLLEPTVLIPILWLQETDVLAQGFRVCVNRNGKTTCKSSIGKTIYREPKNNSE